MAFTGPLRPLRRTDYHCFEALFHEAHRGAYFSMPMLLMVKDIKEL